MPGGAWGIFACLWLATLTAFRRDAAHELLLEGVVFLMAAASFRRAEALRAWRIALGLSLVAGLGLLQLILGQTISPASTGLNVMRWLALAAWCLAVQREVTHARGRFLELAVHGAGAFAALSLLMWWTSAGRIYWWWPTPQLEVLGPWVNRNHFAVWCELLLAPAIWLASERRQFWWAVAALAAGGAASGSRAGLALIALESVVLLLLLGWRRPAWTKSVMALAAFLIAVTVLGGDQLRRKLGDPEPLLYREQIWQSSVALWRAQPWWGHGLGAFAVAYPAKASFDTGELVDHAHSDWLEWGVEGGVVLVALLLSGYLYTLRLTRLSPWLLGVPVAGMHALVDYPFARFPLFLWVVTLLTLAGTELARFKVKRRSSQINVSAKNPHKIGPCSPHRSPSKV